MRNAFAPGDWVIYRKSKRSSTPGPRAQDVIASSKGENYSYVVDKFWVVDKVLPDGQLVLRTRRGKLHQVSPDDENLRCARWYHRMFYRHRFRQVAEAKPRTDSGKVTGPAGAV